MRNIKLDSVLLFMLVIPFIMAVRIGPNETPFFLFGIIFGLLIFNIILDLLKIKEKTYFLLKKVVLWITIVVVLGSAFGSAIIVRHRTHPIYMIHDIVLQQEAAIRFLLDGKNPYKETYFNTPMKEWNYSEKEVNPALYHFVMEPFYLVFSLPFYYVSNHTIGYFDGRIPLVLLFFVSALAGSFMIREQSNKRLFLVLFLFSPALLPYVLEGRSDMYMFGFFMLGLLLLYVKKPILASILIALAFSVKQSIWPIFPFFLAFLYFTEKRKTIVHSLIAFSVTFLLIVGPFFMWNQKAFLDSTVYFISGQTEHSYPISGYGFGRILLDLNVIKDSYTYYPFILWQAIFGTPLLIGLIYYLKKNPSIQRLLIVYGVFLFAYWYFSQYFHNSHLGYLSVVFLCAYFLPDKKPSA